MDAKVIMLTGASKGMGESIALKLIDCGYLLSLGLRQPHADTSQWPADAHVFQYNYDALVNETAQPWVDATLKRYGRIDGVINCAGQFLDCEIGQLNLDHLDALIQVNTKAPIILTEAAWPYLKSSRCGRIINIASLAAKYFQGGNFGYALSKQALLAFTHALRQAGWDDGIRATAICPGWTNTDMAKASALEPNQMTQPGDVAELVQTILSLPNSASIAEIVVNCQRHELF